MNLKYVRVQTRHMIVEETGEPIGIFHACWRLLNDNIMEPDDIHRFLEVDTWFTRYLPSPPIFRGGEFQKIVTWFKCETSEEMLQKLEPALEILDKYNVIFDIMYTNDPGTVIYEDDYQIATVDDIERTTIDNELSKK